MSDSTSTVRPVADSALGGWTLTGAASAWAALSDDSDATYADGAASAGAVLRVQLAAAALADHDLLRYVRPWIRASSPAGTRVVGVRLYGLGAGQVSPEQTVTLGNAAARYDLLPYQGWPTGRPFATDDLAALFLAFREVTSPLGALRLIEAGLDVVFNSAPTAVVTAPVGTVADNCRVALTWTYSDPEGDQQARSRGRIYAIPYGGWPQGAVDADAEVAALDAAGAVPELEFEQIGDLTFGPSVLLAAQGAYRAYVGVGDAGTAGRYGPWASSDFAMLVPGQPIAPAAVAVPDPATAQVRLEVAPALVAVDEFEVERSDDGGFTWLPVVGLRDPVPYTPESPNVINGAALVVDSDGDGFADGFSAYSTGGGDPAPTGELVAGVDDGEGGQRVTFTTNTGRKGVEFQPRVGADGSDVWPDGSSWLLSLWWSADDASVVPTLWFPDGGSFTVTWLVQPTPTTDYQQYVAEIVAPNVDTAGRVAIGSTAADHRFDLSKPQLEPTTSSAVSGAMAADPMGAEPMGGASTASGADSDLVPSPWRAREDVAVVVVDRFAPRELVVQYRVRTVANAGLGTAWGTVEVTSDWATTDPVVLASDGNVWLQSSVDQGLDWAFCAAGTNLTGTSDEDQVAYTAEGREDAVLVRGTVHGENFPTLVLALQDDADRDALDLLRREGGTLLLRLLYGDADGLEQAWVKIGAQVSQDRQGGYPERATAQLRMATFPVVRVSEPTT